MNIYSSEEIISDWSRGDVRGEWTLSHDDIETIFGPIPSLSPRLLQQQERQYAGDEYMLPHMTSGFALAFNAAYRDRQEEKMRMLPWNVNLMNAFHNLHFICYMANMLPDFENETDDGRRCFRMDVPGRYLWILQLVMKAATECLRDGFVRIASRKDNGYKYRATPLAGSDWVGFELHISGCCIYTLTVEFRPTFTGPLGCEYSVGLECNSWRGGRLSMNGKPLKDGMLAMKKYIRKELDRFDDELRCAEFNRLENWLFERK